MENATLYFILTMSALIVGILIGFTISQTAVERTYDKGWEDGVIDAIAAIRDMENAKEELNND